MEWSTFWTVVVQILIFAAVLFIVVMLGSMTLAVIRGGSKAKEVYPPPAEPRWESSRRESPPSDPRLTL